MMIKGKYRIVPVVTILYSLCALGQGLATTAPEDVGLSSQRLERLTQVMQSEVDENRLPGSVALIARHGKVAYVKSFGMADREADRAMFRDNLFRIASMTKPITSVAVMMLYEEGQLLLTDPLSHFIPEFKNPQVLETDEFGQVSLVPAKTEITVRHLLNHTSGMTYGDNDALQRVH